MIIVASACNNDKNKQEAHM